MTRFETRGMKWMLAAAVCAAAAACGADDEVAVLEPRELATPAAPGSAEPNLTTGADGRVYLSWVEPGPDSTHALRFAVLEEDGRWSAPRTVASGPGWFVNWADFPSLRVLEDGRMAAHWLQRSGAGRYAYEVRIALSADGGRTWTPGVVPHRDGTASEHGFVSLWPAGGDSVGAAWLDGRGYAGKEEGDSTAQMLLMEATLARDGTAGAERPVDARVCDCCQTAVAMTPRGPLVAYRDRSPQEVRDVYVVRRVNGAWTEPRPVHADGWVIPACPVNGPAADGGGDGGVAVAWFTAARDTQRVLVAFSGDAGESFGAPVRVDGGAPLGRVDVLRVGSGALVSWLEAAGEKGAEVRVRHVGRDGTLGAVRVIATSSAERASGFPHLARAGDVVVFAWTVPGDSSTVHTAVATVEGT